MDRIRVFFKLNLVSSNSILFSSFGQKCFSYKGAKLWKDLSVEVKSLKSHEIFKKRINNANTEC